MRTVLVIALCAAAAFALSESQEWAKFKLTYGRRYSAEEEPRRFKIFVDNLKKAAQLSDSNGAIFGATKFADLTTQEFIARHTGLNMTKHRQFMSKLPVHVATSNALGTDWKTKGKVTPIKDQGSCGSCFAFSATGAAEGCYAIALDNTPVSLSIQQILDCCDQEGCNGGCDGGFEYTALEWAVTQDLAAEEDYPYTGYQGTCKKPKKVTLPANSCKFYQIAKTEKAMREALTHGTVTVALDATQLQLYVSGVLSKCSGTSLNHALLLVSDEASGSYVIKNSWGEDWGENGYFRMVQDKGCLGINLDYHSVAY